MNEKPETSLSRKSTSLSPRWLIVFAVIFVLTAIVIAMIGGLHNPSDWASAFVFTLLFSSAVTPGLWLGYRWRRHWRRALFVLASLVTLIALFYAEEDWRGSHAYNQFRREAEAKGARFDLASVVPPPVPDDQNFALTPVVASGYGQILDRTGHEIRPRNDKLVNRLSMHYWLDLEGNDYPSKLSDWTLGHPTDLAALQQFYRTQGAKTNTLRFPSPPQSPAADVLFALSRFDPTIEELRQAAQLPYSRFPLEYDKDNPWAIYLPHLASLKCADQVLSLRATAELQTGRSEQGLADVKLQLRLTDSIRNEPFLISHLVRIAMVQLTLQPVWEGLADHRWSEAQLAELEAELAKLDFLADYRTSMQSDLAYMSREIAYLRQHPEEYFHLNDGWPFGAQLVNPNSDRTMAVLMEAHLVPSGWFYQNLAGYDRIMAQYFWPAAEVQSHTFVMSLMHRGDEVITNECRHVSPGNILECLILQWPIEFDACTKFAHGQSSADLARVAIALERCRLAQGRYPETLEGLAPRYLGQVPHDVIGGQPLHYRLTEDGQFVLYSVGSNETDDGGVAGLTPGKNPSQDFSQGDWVWRYPQK